MVAEGSRSRGPFGVVAAVPDPLPYPGVRDLAVGGESAQMVLGDAQDQGGHGAAEPHVLLIGRTLAAARLVDSARGCCLPVSSLLDHSGPAFWAKVSTEVRRKEGAYRSAARR